VSAHDLQRLEQLDKKRDEDFAFIEKMRSRFKGIPADEIEREIDRAIAAVRARNANTKS
jgi:hypothetical protein